MNELKFRIWDKRNNKYFLEPRLNISLLNFPQSFSITNFDNEIEQFVGLLDINGRQIYENDVVKFHYFGFNGSETDINEIGIIRFSEKMCGFTIHSTVNEFTFLDTSHFEEPCIEIIGNIHENPEFWKIT